MRGWGIAFTVAMGFLLGFVLAGIGGVSVGLQAAQSDRLERKKGATYLVEDYWAASDLHEKDLRRLINDKTCYLSEKYFLACVNSVNHALVLFKQRLDLNGQIQAVAEPSQSLDHLTEKEILQPFSEAYRKRSLKTFSFNRLWDDILNQSSQQIPFRYLLGLGINGYLSVSKDPHTYILPIDYFDKVSSTSDRSPYFVGLSLEKTQKGLLKIRKVSKNSDADLAGLKSGQLVYSINAIKSESMTLSEVGRLLKDQSLSKYVIETGKDQSKEFKTIQRSYRVLSQVHSEIIAGRKNYGLISIAKFSKNTCDEVQKAIADMQNQNIAGLIIDLRDNPGGRLSEAACLAGLFIGNNKSIYSVEYFDLSKTNEVVLTSSERIYSGPLAVLVNNSSASASELFAGAIQEYRRGLVMGVRTYGKGTFQEIENWNDLKKVGYFKTKGFYLLPSGQSTQFKGIDPDIQIPEVQVSASSEENNYFNPIKPVNIELVQNKLSLPLQQCSPINEPTITDQILSKVLQHLSCSSLMSYIAMQFDPK